MHPSQKVIQTNRACQISDVDLTLANSSEKASNEKNSTNLTKRILMTSKREANKPRSFSARLAQLLQRCKTDPNPKIVMLIEERFSAVTRQVYSSNVFLHNQLTHSVVEHCRTIVLVRVQQYHGLLGCAFSGAHSKLVSVQLSCETCQHPQTIEHREPIVMQTHMAQLIRCLCVLRTWTQLDASPHWIKGVCRSYKTLRLAARALPRS